MLRIKAIVIEKSSPKESFCPQSKKMLNCSYELINKDLQLICMLSKYRVLVAEDDGEVADSLAIYLSSFGAEVHKVSDGEELLEKHLEHRPHIILCDIQMPKLNGLDAIRQIRQSDSAVRVIFISAFSDTDKLLSAINLNTSGYIVKPIGRLDINDRIVEAIKHLEMHKIDNSSNISIIRIGQNLTYDAKTKTLLRDNKKIYLTQKELVLFAYLVSKQGHVCFYNELIFEVWGQYDSLQEYANVENLKNFVKKIRKKLKEDVIKNRYAEGYLIEKD